MGGVNPERDRLAGHGAGRRCWFGFLREPGANAQQKHKKNGPFEKSSHSLLVSPERAPRLKNRGLEGKWLEAISSRRGAARHAHGLFLLAPLLRFFLVLFIRLLRPS